MTQAAVAATPKNTFTSADPITAGFIARQMFLWEAKIAEGIYQNSHSLQAKRKGEVRHQNELPADSWDAKHADIPCDWMSGGLFILAETIAFAVNDAPMEWDDGVFVYTHCGEDDRSVWLPIVEKMTADEWQNLCGNNIVPKWTESEVLNVMKGLGLLSTN